MGARLGDVIDDYCPRCRRVTNHSLAAMVGGVVAQTACRTCNHAHEYRRAEVPPPKSKATKASAFDQVLAGILATQPQPEASAPPRRGAKAAAPRTRKPLAR